MNDTIVAISTPQGTGAIAVLRLSGPDAFGLAQRHLKRPLADRTAVFSTFAEGDSIIDEVVAIGYRSPHSYTGEDMVEISCHGSQYLQRHLLQLFLDDGARLAEPGEFTRRAFLAGKFDLSQAEAVADLIDSTTPAASNLAMSQLRGGYADRLKSMRAEMVELTSLLELELDFSQEDVEFADRGRLLALADRLENECRTLVDSFQTGNALKNGLPVAIVGKPNVGKSTLLNALLGDDRAIVSDIPGTTRDTIEDSSVIEGCLVRFVDTAGLRQSSDTIENEGIQRSIKAVQKAAVVLYVVEAAQTPASVEQELRDLAGQVSLDGKQLVVVYNKADQAAALPDGTINVSAKYGTGLDTLRQAIVSKLAPAMNSGDVLLANARHYESLSRLLPTLQNVRHGIETDIPADLVVIDLREALYLIGTITGEVSSEEILTSIFTRFCIGK